MSKIAEKLDEKLAVWDRQSASEVERMVDEIIELADHDVLDLLPRVPSCRKFWIFSNG